MSTIINTPSREHHNHEDGMGIGMILGIIIAVLGVIVLFYIYGLLAIRGSNTPTTTETTNTYNVTVPDPIVPAPEN